MSFFLTFWCFSSLALSFVTVKDTFWRRQKRNKQNQKGKGQVDPEKLEMREG